MDKIGAKLLAFFVWLTMQIGEFLASIILTALMMVSGVVAIILAIYLLIGLVRCADFLSKLFG